MRISPVHSTSEEDMVTHRYVYHDHDDCFYERRIKPENKKSGTGGFPKCDECIRLG